MTKPAYVGVFLDRPSREYLLGRVPARHQDVYTDHLTLAFGSAMSGKYYPVGMQIELRVWAIAWDLHGQAALCRGSVMRSFLADGQIPHITLSCARGTPPKYSNELVKNCMWDGFRHEIRLTGILDYYPRTVPDRPIRFWANTALKWRNFYTQFI